MPERAVDRTEFREQTAGTSRVCVVFGCDATTREKKPWCPEHVEDHAPPAIRIAEELKSRDAEIKRIMANKGKVDPNGHLAREARRMLHEQAFTSAGLSRDLNIPHKVAEAVLNHLVKIRIACHRTVRGKMAVSLKVRRSG
jgi:hypothetical protein